MATQIIFDASKKILAMDVATKTGWAISAGASGTWQLGSRDPGNDLRASILGIHADYGIAQIALEYSAFGGRFKAVKDFHNQLLGVVRLVNAELGLPPVILINPMTMKKFWTGSGRADKDQMKRACLTWLGREVTSGDEADALAALAMIDSGWKMPAKAKKKRKPGKLKPVQKKLGFLP